MSSPSLRARLLLGARDALLRHGVDGVEVADVAAAAGLPPGAFYRCFPSRDALLEALVGQAVRAGGAAVERAVGAPADPAVAVAAFVRQTVRVTERDPLLACLASGARSVAEALTDDFSRRVLRSVSRGVWVGRFPVSSARVHVCAIRGAVLEVLRGRLQGTLPAAAADELAAGVLQMLGLPPGEALAIVAAPLPEVGPDGAGAPRPNLTAVGGGRR